MASLSGLFTSLTGAGFYYDKSPRHATYNFNQDARSLYRNHPRLPFEFYVNFNLNQVGSAKEYISRFFNSADLSQIAPLVKSIDMPPIKIQTEALNQYNRKRLSQTRVTFDPIKIVFHDVADGKTLKFWEMYYRYYFSDGNEPGKNQLVKSSQQKIGFSDSLKKLGNDLIPGINPNIKSLFGYGNKSAKSTNDIGIKSDTQNIIQDTLNNHHFGFNLSSVQNTRNLIQSIDIYQVHGGRFNKVTLVNPRISAFNHDNLNYATGDKTLELTFTVEYEYAYYTIQNKKLGEDGSSSDQFSHGETLELPALAFNASILDFIESNNPLLTSDNPILQRIGKNIQSSIGGVTGSFISNKITRPVSASVLNGMANISPTPYNTKAAAPIQARNFQSAAKSTTTSYTDVNRSPNGV